jgi:hypothetical protein
MSDKARRQGTSKRNRRRIISAVAIFIVLISVLAIIGSLNQKPPVHNSDGLKDSSTYFTISDLAGLYERRGNISDQSPPMVLIKQFAFNFTPVGGDANDVRIFVPGFADPLKTDWEGILIPNGTSIHTGDIQPAYAIPSYRESDGTYTLTIRIAAKEADGNLMLNFTTTGPEQNLVPIV